jgi:zinc/manganese transport system substrate-binding protein
MSRWILAVVCLAWPLTTHAQEPISVVATFSVLGDITHQVGGASVSVTTLVPPDGDAHTYEPKPSDLIAIKDASVVVVNGLGMEGWIDRAIKAAGGHATRVVATTGVKPHTMSEEGKKITDPHAWQDPANGVIYATNIAEGLVKADPAHADAYHANAERYVAQIRETDAWIVQQLSDVPPTKRKIITSHDAFGYFGSRFGIEFRGVQGVSTESEPTPKEIEALVKQIKHDHIKAVFVENLTDPRYTQMLAREAGAVVGETVYSDALSPPGGPADTYLKMFHHNVPLFVEAMRAN